MVTQGQKANFAPQKGAEKRSGNILVEQQLADSKRSKASRPYLSRSNRAELGTATAELLESGDAATRLPPAHVAASPAARR